MESSGGKQKWNECEKDDLNKWRGWRRGGAITTEIITWILNTLNESALITRIFSPSVSGINDSDFLSLPCVFLLIANCALMNIPLIRILTTSRDTIHSQPAGGTHWPKRRCCVCVVWEQADGVPQAHRISPRSKRIHTLGSAAPRHRTEFRQIDSVFVSHAYTQERKQPYCMLSMPAQTIRTHRLRKCRPLSPTDRQTNTRTHTITREHTHTFSRSIFATKVLSQWLKWTLQRKVE